MQLLKATIDTQKPSYRSIGQVNAGDDLELELEIKMNGQSIDFINPLCGLIIKKSDDNRVLQNKDILYKDGKFKIKVDKQGVTCPGIVTCQLLTKEDGRVSTCLFYLMVGSSLDREIIQSIDKVEVLEQLDEYVVTAFANLEEFEKRIASQEETIRKLNEDMNEAEKTRVEAEKAREENEADRVSKEQERNAEEVKRKSNEEAREKAELERIEAEKDREASEDNRILSENKRLDKEQKRDAAETERVSNEDNRIKAESNRNAAEEVRAKAESERSTAETKRLESFKVMETENKKFKEEVKNNYKDFINSTDGLETSLAEKVNQATTKNEELKKSLDETKKYIDGLEDSTNVPQLALDLNEVKDEVIFKDDRFEVMGNNLDLNGFSDSISNLYVIGNTIRNAENKIESVERLSIRVTGTNNLIDKQKSFNDTLPFFEATNDESYKHFGTADEIGISTNKDNKYGYVIEVEPNTDYTIAFKVKGSSHGLGIATYGEDGQFIRGQRPDGTPWHDYYVSPKYTFAKYKINTGKNTKILLALHSSLKGNAGDLNYYGGQMCDISFIKGDKTGYDYYDYEAMNELNDNLYNYIKPELFPLAKFNATSDTLIKTEFIKCVVHFRFNEEYFENYSIDDFGYKDYLDKLRIWFKPPAGLELPEQTWGKVNVETDSNIITATSYMSLHYHAADDPTNVVSEAGNYEGKGCLLFNFLQSDIGFDITVHTTKEAVFELVKEHFINVLGEFSVIGVCTPVTYNLEDVIKIPTFENGKIEFDTNINFPKILTNLSPNLKMSSVNNSKYMVRELDKKTFENIQSINKINGINKDQDELIDVNLMATDEMFTMLEPLLAQIVTTEKGVSKMVDLYVAMVQRGLKTIDQVPVRYREQVKEILEQLEK